MLEIKNLTGGYVHVPVLKDVSFTVESGQLVGLIGLNGAGKSTTINEIIGLLTPYSGSININSLTLQEDATSYRKQIGYIPETPSLYEELTLREHIETVAMAYGIEQKVAFDRVEPLLKMFWQERTVWMLGKTWRHDTQRLVIVDSKKVHCMVTNELQLFSCRIRQQIMLC